MNLVSLFAQLRRLHLHERFQLEDFHTEIVAQVLREMPSLALVWLRRVKATNLVHIHSHSVVTQKTFPALDGHDVDSRPDMVICLDAEGFRELIFVESKIGSTAGYGQMNRYLDHLASQRVEGEFHRVTLVFVTRDFEADYAGEFAKEGTCPAGVAFRQTRWFEFHRLLHAIIKENSLAAQLALFMQENRMNLRHRFRTLDLLALENFLAAKALMDETLDGKVRQTFQAKLQDVSTLPKALKQLHEQNRYVLYTTSWPCGHYECLAGYFLPANEADGDTSVCVMFNCGPGGSARKDYIAAFHDWTNQGTGWTAAEGEYAWYSLSKGRSLTSFLGENDHVEAIRSYLLGLLDEVSAFLEAHPELPWRDEEQTKNAC